MIRSSSSSVLPSFLSSLLLASSLFGAAACDWREFDDIADTTWVDTSGAPSGVDSSDFAVALAEANNETAGETKKLAVVSRSRLTLAFLTYGADGAVTVNQSISLDSNSGGPFVTLPQSPVYASDPRSAKVAVAGDGKIAIGEPTKGTLDVASGPNSAKAAGLTFLKIDADTYVAAATERGISLINVATPTTTTTICTLAVTVPPVTISRIVALGTVVLGGVDKLVAWYETSNATPAELNAFTVAVANGNCTLTAVAGAADTSVSMPTRSDYPLVEGARIVTIPGTEAVAVADPLKGMVAIHQFGATRAVSAFSAPDVASLAIGSIGADTYLFAGASNHDIEGVSNAGRVQATKLTGVTAETTPSLTLYDASPSTEQRFGRAVAVVPFADATAPIVVVGADDEMFSYFRTSLYDERRAP